MARSVEATRALEALKEVWRAQSLAARAFMILGVGVLVIALVAGAGGLVKGAFRPRPDAAGPAPRAEAPPPPAQPAAQPTMTTVDGPVTLSLEKGSPDPAGKLRRIAAGELPTLQIGYNWIGILKEVPIDRNEPPPGRSARFEWSRRPASWATIEVFDSSPQAAAAFERLSGTDASDILMPNPDGKTRYTPLVIPSLDGDVMYDMRCAIRARLFYCSVIPEGTPAIVTVKLRIDTVAGPTPEEGQAKVAELVREMRKETDEVMRSLAAQGLDGSRAVAR